MSQSANLMSDFSIELEAFRHEQESAQQFFFGYLSLQEIPGSNDAVLNALNEHPQFWIATRFALLVATFLALGRLFDQDSRSIHNIDRLTSHLSKNITAFSREGLRARRIAEGMDPTFSARYVADKHDLSVDDIRNVRSAVKKWRNIYNERYRIIRHSVFAHRAVRFDESETLFANTRTSEMLEMLGFLDALYTSLWELQANGRPLDLRPKIFTLPPVNSGLDSHAVGERTYSQAMDLMFGKLLPASIANIEQSDVP